MRPTAIHQTIASQTTWLNTSRALTPEDLAGRIILLDFWTFCCINCIHVIPDLKYLEEKFGDKLTVIGVHSAKFKNEQDTENIRSAILRYGVEHPVVNDFDFSIWQRFGVRAWPTFMLVSPQGTVEETYSGEGNRAQLEHDIQALIDKSGKELVRAPLPMAPEKDKAPKSVLSFPGKLAYGNNTLFISDSGNHRIVMTPSGEAIGSGEEGFKDGDFASARFRRPQGMAYDVSTQKLYIADTENHALRMADLKNKTVVTIAGTGKQGFERGAKSTPALSTPLASPWDLEFFPDTRHLAIAMAGTHQLWSYDIENKAVSVIAGNGRESIDDGAYPYNSLSQPSGLSAHGGKLYFVDSETSSLRVFDGKNIQTLIGTGLFDFGFKDGQQGSALMQHALGVFADDPGVYVADSYNHAIRKYDLASGQLATLAGDGTRGALNEPNDVLKIGETLYVADTNNHRIQIIEGGKARTLNVTPVASQEAPEYSDGLPNETRLLAQTIAAGRPTEIELQLAKGWKINADAPSYIAVFDAGKKPIARFSLAQIRAGKLAFDAPTGGKDIILQGTLYYCEDKEGSQCLLKSITIPLELSTKDATQTLIIPVN